MALILKSIKTPRNLVKFVQYISPLCSREEFSSLMWKNLLPVNSVVRSYSPMIESNRLRGKNFEKSVFDISSNRNRYLNKSDIENILSQLQKLNSITYPQSLGVLKCCFKISFKEPPETRVILTHKVWDALVNMGVQLDIFHYNILLLIYIQNEHKFSPDAFLKNLEKECLEPNLITYERLMRAFCLQGDMSGASALLEKMKKEDMPINEDIFNSLICGNCKVDDPLIAWEVIYLMQQKGIQPSPESYSHLLNFYASKGNFDKINEIFLKLESLESEVPDKVLLELIYVLATSNHEVFIDSILKRIVKSVHYNELATQLIHRLLLKNLDQVAFKIHETISVKYGQEEPNKSIFLLHYLNMRSPEETIKFCMSVKDPDDFNKPLASVLKNVLKSEDFDKCKQYFKKIAEFEKDFELRPHYFWPMMLLASKQGNHKLLEVLNLMKELKVKSCAETVCKFVFPNYVFSKNFIDDLEILEEYGVRISLLSSQLLLKFLSENNLENALVLSKTQRVTFLNYKTFIVPLIDCLDREKVSNIVQVLYYYLHDIHEYNSLLAYDNLEWSPIDNIDTFLNNFLKGLIKKHSPSLVLEVLKELNKKSLWISEETAGEIKDNFKNYEEITKLADEMSCTSRKETQFLDETVLKNKTRKLVDDHATFQRAAHSNNLTKAKSLYEKLGENKTRLDTIVLMTALVRKNQIEKALELAETLKRQEDISLFKETKSKFSHFLFNLSETGDMKSLEKAIEIGKELNFCSRGKDLFLIKAHLIRNEIEEAVDIFCKVCEEKKFIVMYDPLVRALIKSQNANLLYKVTNATAFVIGEKKSLMNLFFEFVKMGHHKQARKLLETEWLEISEANLKYFSYKCLQKNNQKALESLLEASKNFFNVKHVLIALLELYIKNDYLQNVKDFWLMIQQENFPVDNVLFQKLSDYLHSKGHSFPESEKSIFNRKTKSGRKVYAKETEFKNEEELNVAYEKSLNRELSTRKAEDLMIEMIKLGRFEDFYPVLEVYKKRIRVNKLVSKLLKRGYVKEYMSLVEKSFQTDPRIFNKLFLYREMRDHVEKDKNLLKDLIKFAIMGSETHSSYQPARSIMFLCLDKPEYIEMASQLFNKLEEDEFRNAMLYKGPNLLEKILLSEHVNQRLRPLIYSTLIKHYETVDDVDKALDYLNKAVDEGCGHLLNKDCLNSLKSKMDKVDFPYPDLLVEGKETVQL